jgi:hypothetical protein
LVFKNYQTIEHSKCTKKIVVLQAADADRDGMVSGDEFNKMIDMATAAQKRSSVIFACMKI